jgi:hypothetical protein
MGVMGTDAISGRQSAFLVNGDIGYLCPFFNTISGIGYWDRGHDQIHDRLLFCLLTPVS